MIIHRIGHRVLRIPLTMAVVVDYQIPCEPHQPVRQVTLFGVVLIKCSVDANENFLGEILCRVRVRCESISEIEDPPRERLDNFFPGHAIARSRSTHEFSPIDFPCSL